MREWSNTERIGVSCVRVNILDLTQGLYQKKRSQGISIDGNAWKLIKTKISQWLGLKIIGIIRLTPDIIGKLEYFEPD
jgi:hypothetical protein